MSEDGLSVLLCDRIDHQFWSSCNCAVLQGGGNNGLTLSRKPITEVAIVMID